MKRSPPQLTVFPAKLASQTAAAAKSLSGSNQQFRKNWPLHKTRLSMPAASKNRKRTVMAKSAQAQLAPPAVTIHRAAHSNPNVNTRPKYPPGRESRIPRDHRN